MEAVFPFTLHVITLQDNVMGEVILFYVNMGSYVVPTLKAMISGLD
jgi:hypothetical protein